MKKLIGLIATMLVVFAEFVFLFAVLSKLYKFINPENQYILSVASFLIMGVTIVTIVWTIEFYIKYLNKPNMK